MGGARTEHLFTRFTEFLRVFKNSKCKTSVNQIAENSTGICSYQNGKNLESWTRQNLPVSKRLRKERSETIKRHRRTLPFFSFATPLWKTFWDSWFVSSNTFYQLSRKSNPVFKMTLLELTCRRDKNTKIRHETKLA